MEPGIPIALARRWGAHVLTYMAEGSVLIGTVLVYKLAAMRFEEEGFNIYAVVRRTVSFILPFAMMGLSVAVVRAVAMSLSDQERWSMVRDAGFFILGIAFLIALAFLIFPQELAFLTFGENGMAPYALPLGGMVAGQLMHALMYSYWRGAHSMSLANGLQMLNMAVVPIVAFVITDTLVEVLGLTALLWLGFSIIPFIYLLFRNAHLKTAKGGLKRLLRYGIPRVPGDLALAGLLSIPVYLVNHVEGLENGGQVAFGLTLLNLTGALFAPISLLMLPSVSHALARKDHDRVVNEVVRTRNVAIVTGFALVIVFQLVAGPVLDLYLDGAPEGLVFASRILFSGALFFAIFISLRSLLDAYFEHARNSFNILIAFALFSIGGVVYLYVYPELWFILVMVPLALLLLAALTWRNVSVVMERLLDPNALEKVNNELSTDGDDR